MAPSPSWPRPPNGASASRIRAARSSLGDAKPSMSPQFNRRVQFDVLLPDPAVITAEKGLGTGDVREDLGPQRRRGFEFALGAEAAQEFEADALRRVAIEGIELEGLHGQRVAVEGGTVTDVGDGVPVARGFGLPRLEGHTSDMQWRKYPA